MHRGSSPWLALCLAISAMALAACSGHSSQTGHGTAARAATSSFAFAGAAAVSVADCPGVTGESAAWCRSNWPPATSGTVFQYAFTETRLADGSRQGRTAYVYKPAAITGGSAYPLLTYLHGGTQSGETLFALLPFAQLADGRSAATPVEWVRNSAACQQSPLGSSAFGLGGTTLSGFVATSDHTSACDPDHLSYARPASAPAFYLVYPNGIEDFDGGGRSWEDGRNPSPGQFDTPNPDAEKRDDVAFIDTLIAQVKSREGALVDASRVYVGGISNGGIMTHRLLCNIGNGNFPELEKVAAFSVSVASMADNIFNGDRGREHCPAQSNAIAPLAIFVGYDSPTPDSQGQPFVANCNPYNPGNPRFPTLPACPYAPVSGDDTIPYGRAFDTGGGVFTVNSLSTGNVIASFDDQNFWLDYLSRSGAGASHETRGDLGFFTHYRRYTFAGSPLVYQVYETQNGLHLNGGTRFDFSVVGRIYDFLFAFRKSGGRVSSIGGAYDPQTATFGNLNGTW